MASNVNKNAYPESVSSMNNKSIQIPQSRKNMQLDEALSFLDQVMTTFRSLEDMSDLKSMFETGKQLSRLYFDCSNNRSEIAEALNVKHEFPNFASKMMKKLNNMGVFKNDDIWFSSFYFYNVTWNFSDCSPGFASSLGLAGLPNLLNLNIGHQPYLDNLSSKNVYYLMKASLSLMHNIARVPNNAHFFSDETVRRSLVNLMQREEEFLKCVATLTLGYIIGESDSIMADKNESEVITKLFSFIRLAVKSEKKRYHGFNVEELIAALSAMAVNNSAKKCIANQEGISLIKDLCNSENALELEYVCRTLWNLSFDSEIKNKLMTQYDMVPALVRLKSHPVPTVSKVAEGTLWIIRDENQHLEKYHKTAASLAKGDKSNGMENYVFISYSWYNKETVLKLCEKLRECGITVWIDIEQLKELTPAAVAQGIEQSKVVLLCVSEPYRTSPNCRTEAQYAHALKKPIIPVIMQHKYRMSSWLASMFKEDTASFEFGSKRNFDSSFELLLLSLKEIINSPSKKPELDREIKGEPMGSNTPVSVKPNSPKKKDLHNNNIGNSIEASSGGGGGGGGELVKVNDIGGHQKVLQESLKGTDNVITRASKWGSQERSLDGSGATMTTLLIPVRLDAKILEWTCADVAHWLEKHDLGTVATVLKDVNGRLLAQMFQIRREAPEFFFHYLDNKLRFQFIEILRFSEAVLSLSST